MIVESQMFYNCCYPTPGWYPKQWISWAPICIFVHNTLVHMFMVFISWRQPLRVDGPKASQRSIITYEIHFCTDQAKTHRVIRFWFDISYDARRVHRQMLRIKFCCFLFVFWRKVLPRDFVYKMAGSKTPWHLAYDVLWRRHTMHT